MIDTSRHFYPLEVILQHIDAMAYTKVSATTRTFYCDLLCDVRV